MRLTRAGPPDKPPLAFSGRPLLSGEALHRGAVPRRALHHGEAPVGYEHDRFDLPERAGSLLLYGRCG